MIRIRRAAAADRPAIAALHAQSWRDSYQAILPERFLRFEIDAIMAARWEAQAVRPEDSLLLAEAEHGLLGFCAAWDGESAYIDNLHVRSDARSQGIGRRLLAATAAHFLQLGRRRAHLHVIAVNARAKALYLALGGRAAGLADKDLYGTIVENERIEWDDLDLLRAAAGPSAEASLG